MKTLCMESLIGPLWLSEEGGALTRLAFFRPAIFEAAETPLLCQAKRQLEEYFSGARKTFSLPLAPAGTPFQKLCWDALCQIPYGETRSYSEQAAAIGRPKACRAVGSANHHNPISILIPCHRVVGASGGLTGYGGGLEKKEFLLKLEQAYR